MRCVDKLELFLVDQDVVSADENLTVRLVRIVNAETVLSCLAVSDCSAVETLAVDVLVYVNHFSFLFCLTVIL